MTTAQSNRPDPFEASSGFSPEEAERLASAFKPSWEFDEAPFAQGGGMDAVELDRLAAGGVNGDIRGRQAPAGPMAVPAVDERGSGHAKSAAPRMPPARVETHEPDVSVIIDRSITVSELAQAHAAQPAPHVQAAPVLAPPPPTMRTGANPSTTAKRAQRREASESLEIPKALRSSNKGLFIGIGVAAAAAVAILAIRAATASSDAPAAATPPTPPPTTANAGPVIPPIPAIPPPTPPAATAYAPPPASPQPVTQARVPAQAPAPHRAATPPPHHAAPKSPPKPTGGGIVRDVPF